MNVEQLVKGCLWFAVSSALALSFSGSVGAQPRDTSARVRTTADGLLDVSAISPQTRSLDTASLDRLAEAMVLDQRDVQTLNSVLFQFYSLNDKDVEQVLKSVRQQTYDTNLAPLEPAVAKALHELNVESMRAHRLPFHLAVARGGLPIPGEEIFSRAGLSTSAILTERAQSPATVTGCSSGHFDRRIPYTWKLNRLQWAWSWLTWSDPALGSACHWKHGTFSKTIQEWNSYNPAVVCMVYANGLGGKLAADAQNFLYKGWTIVACGAPPALILGSLRSRY